MRNILQMIVFLIHLKIIKIAHCAVFSLQCSYEKKREYRIKDPVVYCDCAVYRYLCGNDGIACT